MDFSAQIYKLTDHLFRRESGKMVAVLTKIFGAENLEMAEDVVQQSFIEAMNHWKLKGIPDNPSAWLYRVAKNKAIDVIRKNKYSRAYDFTDPERKLLTSEYTLAPAMEEWWKEEWINDDMLRMMYACCHPGISVENQITLILKTICGFSTAEIAKTFLTSEDTISKRLYRTREYFRKEKLKLEIPSLNELKSRTDAVLHSIYLLFNEGYNSTQNADLIREDLIQDAMMMCKLLSENPHTQLPEVFALLALICFHSARSQSRLDVKGNIILLRDQDRSLWNRDLIAMGNDYMNKSIPTDETGKYEISTYHLESAIAYEHCVADSFQKTNWERIFDLYSWLEKIAPSSIVQLNKATALFQWKGADDALSNLAKSDTSGLESYYLYSALLGDIYAQKQMPQQAITYYQNAISLTHSMQEKNLLSSKIEDLEKLNL